MFRFTRRSRRIRFEYIINDSGAKVFFIAKQANTYERINEVFPECPSLEKIVFFDSTGVEAENAISLSELESSGRKIKIGKSRFDKRFDATPFEPNDVATLIYTSGTTGEPKGVMLSHANLISNVIDAGAKYSFSQKDKPLSVLPSVARFRANGNVSLHFERNVRFITPNQSKKSPDNLPKLSRRCLSACREFLKKFMRKRKLKAAQSSRLKEKIFDWAIEVGKEYALPERDKNSRFRVFWRSNTALPTDIVFSKLREFFGGKSAFLHFRRRGTVRRHLSDFHRRGHFDYAGLRLDRNFARDYLRLIRNATRDSERSANRFATSRFALPQTAKSKFPVRT